MLLSAHCPLRPMLAGSLSCARERFSSLNRLRRTAGSNARLLSPERPLVPPSLLLVFKGGEVESLVSSVNDMKGFRMETLIKPSLVHQWRPKAEGGKLSTYSIVSEGMKAVPPP